MLMFQGLPPLPYWRVATPMYGLPTASHHYLPPPTTTGCLTRLPAASHDYLLPTLSPSSLRLLREDLRYLCPRLLLRHGDRTKDNDECTRT
jgi:hypothetical protein